MIAHPVATIKARIRRGKQKCYDAAVKQFELTRSCLQEQLAPLQAAMQSLRSDCAKRGVRSLYTACFDELAAFMSAWRAVSKLAGASGIRASAPPNQFDEEAKAMVLRIAKQHQHAPRAQNAERALSLAHAVCDERFQSKLATIDRATSELEPAFEAYCDAAEDYLHTINLVTMTGSAAIDADRKRMLNQLNAGRRALMNQIAAIPTVQHKEHWQSQLREHSEEFKSKCDEVTKPQARSTDL